jgi:ABC-2 type transport system permease protein
MIYLLIANLKMMYRNKQTAFWALFFPLLLVSVFGLFNMDEYSKSKIVITDLSQTNDSRQLISSIREVKSWTVLQILDSSTNSLLTFEEINADYIITIPIGFSETFPTLLEYTASSNSDHELVAATVRDLAHNIFYPNLPSLTTESNIGTKAIDYFDTVLLGLIGLAITTNSVISVTIQISTYRNQQILKRLLATPLPIWKFFVTQITSHLILVMIQTSIILAVGIFIFGANITGNILYMYLIIGLSTIIFLNIGFILSAYANSPAAGSGLGNAVIFPMIFLSGTFFPAEYLPGFLPYVSKLMPLRPMLDSLRDIGLYNMSLTDVWVPIVYLLCWILVSGVIANRVFKFN